MVTSQITNEAYAAAHEGAALVDHNQVGLLKISGETRLDLINRMSTQDVIELDSGEGAATLFTTNIGRMIDRVILYTSSDTVYMLTGENNNDPLARYLMGHVFFNDDFQLSDISLDTAIFGIYGPRAAERLEAAGFEEANLPLHHWREAELGGSTATIHRTDPVAGDGFLVMALNADRERVWSALTATGIEPVDEVAYDFLRIESGRPRFGRELTLDYIPLEAGLWDDVSFNKGCYTGQEIIARMESRGRLAKRLITLQPTEPVEAGAEVSADGRVVGTVTSVAVGPNGPVALGYVKTAALEDGAELIVGDTVGGN